MKNALGLLGIFPVIPNAVKCGKETAGDEEWGQPPGGPGFGGGIQNMPVFMR